MIYHRWCLSPPCIHLHVWCACNKSQEDQRWGECDYSICFAHGYESISRERGEDWGSVSGTPITILSDTHSHWLPLLLLNRELSWGPWVFIPGKLGPGEGGGWDWCQTSRGTRSTWGFNDISISVVWLRGSERPRHLKGRQWKKTV